MRTPSRKEIDRRVEAAFNAHGKNIQFSVMDLGKLAQAGRDAIAAGRDLDEAMKAAIEKYRKN